MAGTSLRPAGPRLLLVVGALALLLLARPAASQQPRNKPRLRQPRCIEDPVVDSKLRDPNFRREIISCILDEGPCNTRFSQNLKRLAPDVMRGLCPPPCTRCLRKQLRKAIGFMQTHHPEAMGTMAKKFNRGKR